MFHVGVQFGHNATATVIEDGRVIFCQSEERLTRVKNSSGMPRRTLDHIFSKIAPPDAIESCTVFTDTVVPIAMLVKQTYALYGEGVYFTRDGMLDEETAKALKSNPAAINASIEQSRAQTAAANANPQAWDAIRPYLAGQIGVSQDKILFCNHHLAHALSTLPFIDLAEDCLIFTLDGEGDDLCATVSLKRGDQIEVLNRTHRDYSIGNIYHLITGLLGMKMGEHEYKVMGLAPYSKREHCQAIFDKLAALLWVDDDGNWRSNFPVLPAKQVLAYLLDDIVRFQRFDNVAGATQAYVETMVARWIGAWVRKTGVGVIACAGGVFMNVKANKTAAEVAGVRRMVVTPSCGDESTAIGCAVFGSLQRQPGVQVERVDALYLGMAFDDAAVEDALDAAGARQRYQVTREADADATAAALLAQGEIVARCRGPMEFGARALGNRSILAPPADYGTVRIINEAIKNRDFWMPFAASVLAERADELLVNPKGMDSPFMMFGFDTTPAGRARIAAAIHPNDGTCRPQMVRRDANPSYHALISRFAELTGTPAVLNTSFNLHGEPLVCSPADAISTMDRCGLKYCVIGDYLLHKPDC